MKQLKWTITFRRIFRYLGTFIYDIYQCLYFLNVWGFLLAQDQTTRLFWLVLIFSTFLFVNVYSCNDICREKTNSRTISEPPKLIPVWIQYDTTDANLQLTVHVYDLVISWGVVFIHYFLLTGVIVSVASMDATPFLARL
jgi:hypothetical protein